MTATRLVYPSTSRIPFRACDSVQVTRMAAAFAGEGLAVTLWHEVDDPSSLGDPFAWYGAEPRLTPCRYPDREGSGRLRRRAGRLAHGWPTRPSPPTPGLALRPRIVYGRFLPQIARWLRSPWAATPERASSCTCLRSGRRCATGCAGRRRRPTRLASSRSRPGRRAPCRNSVNIFSRPGELASDSGCTDSDVYEGRLSS